MDYTNADPYGDGNLLQQCNIIWNKNIQKQRLQNLSSREKKNLVKRKQDGAKKNLKNEKFTEKTNERNAKNTNDAKREAENFQKWESQENTFHLKQAQLRIRIRIKIVRKESIDLIAMYTLSTEKHFTDFTDLRKPLCYLNGLTVKHFENFLENMHEQHKQEKKSRYLERHDRIITNRLEKN